MSLETFARFDLRVAYHETDAMAVVHHSNHIKYFESARIDFLRKKNIRWHDHPDGPLVFAVYSLSAQYLKLARFDDELQVWSQARLQGARVYFQCAIYAKKLHSFIALGTTELIALNNNFRPSRLPKDVAEVFRTLPWDEVWPPPLIESRGQKE